MPTPHLRSAARSLTATLALAALLSPGPVAADDVMLVGPGQRPDPDQVERILSVPVRPRVKRNIRKVDGGAPPEQAARIALQVPFEFDSARLAPEALAQLEALAEGLRRLRGPVRLALDGHADAKGSDAYNDALSLRRAKAVRDHLVAHDVPGEWFDVRGLGRRQPLEGRPPDAAENRRVELSRLP